MHQRCRYKQKTTLLGTLQKVA